MRCVVQRTYKTLVRAVSFRRKKKKITCLAKRYKLRYTQPSENVRDEIIFIKPFYYLNAD